MEKKLTESQVRDIVKQIIRESLEDLQSDDLWTRFGNRNVFNDKGEAAMAAQGDDDEISQIAMNDKGEGMYNPYGEEGDIPDNWKIFDPETNAETDAEADDSEEMPMYKNAMEEGCIKLSEEALRNAIKKTIKEQLAR